MATQKNITLTTDEEVFIRNNYRQLTTRQLADSLGLTFNRVWIAKKILGLDSKNESGEILYNEIDYKRVMGYWINN